jgi:hypothetical protein
MSNSRQSLSLTNAVEAWGIARMGVGMAFAGVSGKRHRRSPYPIHLGVTR